MSKFSVYCDPKGMKELCDLSPYNLKKDLKSINDSEVNRIAEELGNEIYAGIERPPVTAALHWGKGRKAACAKIRVVDVEREVGKSNGYRCIVLVDYINSSAFLLHIYRHGHGEDENIDRRSKNKLNALVDEYISSLEAMESKMQTV